LSENYSKSAEYSRSAAKKSEKTTSINDAIGHSKKRVTSLERLPQTEDVQKQLIDARTALGLYIAQMNHFVEAKEAIDPIIDLAIRHNYKKRLSQIYANLGSYNFIVEEDYPEAFKTFEQALKYRRRLKTFLVLFWQVHIMHLL